MRKYQLDNLSVSIGTSTFARRSTNHSYVCIWVVSPQTSPPDTVHTQTNLDDCRDPSSGQLQRLWHYVSSLLEIHGSIHTRQLLHDSGEMCELMKQDLPFPYH
jgi:hypothetical protein